MKNSASVIVAALFVLSWPGAGCAEPKYPPSLQHPKTYTQPTGSQKLWALATCAVLTESNGCRHDILGGCDRSPKEIKAWQDSLAKWWNTHNREELLETLEWIEEGGHRREFDEIALDLSGASPAQLALIRMQVANNPSVSNKVEIVLKYKDDFGQRSIAAWDFDRYVALCGWGYIAGYFTEDEAWQRIMPAARLLQKTFGSWKELGRNHVVGREFWSWKHTQEGGDRTRRCFDKLKTDPSSPWKRLDWNMDLTSPETIKITDRDREPHR